MSANSFTEGGSRRRLFLLLILITLVGSILRICCLGRESLWNDELSSWYRSSFSSITEVITIGIIPDVHPPAYQILLYFVERSIGDSEMALRLPSVIAGILTIPMMFLLGRKLLSVSAGLFAAALLAVAPIHIWFSQEARSFAILILLVAVSVYFFSEILGKFKAEKHPGKYTVAGFITVGILLEYTHYFGLLILLIEIILLLLMSLLANREKLLILGMCLVPVLVFLPWIPYAAAQTGTDSYITSPAISTVVTLFFWYMSWSKVMLVLLCLLVSGGSLFYFRKRGGFSSFAPEKLILILLWLCIPLALSLLLSFLLVPVFTVRNMMISLPAVLLILSASVHILFPSGWLRFTICAGLCGYLLFSLFFVRKHYSVPHKQQFREVAEYVVNNCDRSNEVLIAASTWNIAYFDYYLEKYSSDISVSLRASDAADFTAIRTLVTSRKPDEFWFIWGHIEPESALIDSISGLFVEVEYQQFNNAGVWIYSGLHDLPPP